MITKMIMLFLATLTFLDVVCQNCYCVEVNNSSIYVDSSNYFTPILNDSTCVASGIYQYIAPGYIELYYSFILDKNYILRIFSGEKLIVAEQLSKIKFDSLKEETNYNCFCEINGYDQESSFITVCFQSKTLTVWFIKGDPKEMLKKLDDNRIVFFLDKIINKIISYENQR